MTIGEQIREARRGASMTQVQLAEIVNVTPTYISHLEHDRHDPSVALLLAIAEATNKTLNVNFVARGKKVVARSPL